METKRRSRRVLAELILRMRRPGVLASVGTAALIIGAAAQIDPANAVRAIPATEPHSVVRVDDTGPAGFADLAERVLPAVIGISTKAPGPSPTQPGDSFDDSPGSEGTPETATPMPGSPDGDGKTSEMTSIGSGFFISPDGYAVTNNHVVENADAAEVQTQDEKKYGAKVIARDPISDLALIKVDGSQDFSYVRVADHLPRVGDWVLAVGSPFGLGGTVTAGIVSARQRNLESVSNEDLIQIDAPINKGDSGGPIFDREGNVVGVNTMIVSPSGGSVGIAFAVPADTINTVIPQLRASGAVRRGWIGVEIQSITPDLAEAIGTEATQGAIVGSVQKDSPGARAELARGDVLTAIGGQAVKNAHDLTKRVQRTAPGSSVPLTVLRNGKQRSVNVTVGQLPEQQQETRPEWRERHPADHE